MSTGKKRGRPKGSKNSHPSPKPAQQAKMAIQQVTAAANELHMPIREVIERAFFTGPNPIDPSVLLQRFMPENPRVYMWAMDQYYGKPSQRVETTGPAGGPMELKLVIERIGGTQ